MKTLSGKNNQIIGKKRHFDEKDQQAVLGLYTMQNDSGMIRMFMVKKTSNVKEKTNCDEDRI